MVNDRSRRAFIASAGSVAGAGAISLASSAAAQTRSRAEDVSVRVSVDAFGAKGDGVADDTQAVRAAIAAAEGQGGGVVHFGRKTYLLSDEIKIDPTKTSLSGNRSVLRMANGAKSPVMLRIAATAASSLYGHGTQYIEGIDFTGLGPSIKSTALLLSTPIDGKSSRIAVRDCVIRDFETGIDHHDRCYLVQYYSVQIFNTRIGISFTSRVDAGENTSLFGCSIFNSDIAISNTSGSNLFSFGCSFDYCRQWFVGAGNVQFFGCWFEKHRPLEASDYPFELSGSRFLVSGGGIMTAGQDFEKGNICEYYFMLGSKQDQVTIDRTTVWNLRTASGALAGGLGTIEVSGLTNVGRLFMPIATKDDSFHNIFGNGGAFEAGDINFPCWLESAGAETISPHSLAWSADGRRYAEAKIVTSNDVARSGRQCLKVQKGIGAGTPLSFNLLANVSPGDALGLRFWWRTMLPAGAEGQFWIQVFFVQALGVETQSSPRIVQKTFWGEFARQLSSGRSDWIMESFNSYDVQEDAPSFCRAPAWATHALLTINLFAAPEASAFYIDDLGGFRM